MNRARILRPLALVLLAAAVAVPALLVYRRVFTSPGRYNLLFVLVDTLRSDHLGAYGYSRDVSPNVDALAARGVLFEDCWAVAPWTIASTATILTGLFPFAHGFVRPETGPLPPAATTLAEVLRERGYRTAGFSANLLVGQLAGFDQGFEGAFETRAMKEGRKFDARQMGDWAVEWLRRNGGSGRFFLYLHYFDPHDNYDDPDGLWRKLAADPAAPEKCPRGDIHEAFDDLIAGKESGLDSKDVQRLIDRYDGEIRFCDREIGRLLDSLKELGLAEETLVVLTSDHGEQFLEHGSLKHGSSLHREELHVPLVFSIPGRSGARERRKERVSSVDIFPTVLSLLDVDAPGPVDGLDLFGTTPLTSDRLVFSETSHGWVPTGGKVLEGQEILSARGPNGETLILSQPGNGDGRQLFQDPREAADLSAKPPAWAADLESALRSWRMSTAARRLPNKTYSPEQLREQVEKLKQLGYIAEPK